MMTAQTDLQLLTPKEFRDEFAPSLSVESVRCLFRREGFPSIQLGKRYYTTRAAAVAWLSDMGGNGAE